MSASLKDALDAVRELDRELTRLRAENAALRDELASTGVTHDLALAAVARERDDLRAAIFGSPDYSAELTNGAFVQMARDTEAGRKGGLERAQIAERELGELREALERIAEYLPSFDYVGRDEFGPRVDFPGSPYDRGKADASKHLSEIARPAAGAEDALRVGRAIRASFGTVSQPAAIEKIGRAALAAMGYEVRD